MTQIVSASDFRQNMFQYFDLVGRGNIVIVKNGKKGENLVQISRAQKWDPVAYRKILKRLASKPVFTAENHPEWATPKKVEQWLRKTRMQSNRNFDKWVNQ